LLFSVCILHVFEFTDLELNSNFSKRTCLDCNGFVQSSSESSGTQNSVEIWNAHFIVWRAMHKYYMCVHRAKASCSIGLNSLAYDMDLDDHVTPRKVNLSI
jgi:hypothetical protein